MQTMKYLKYKVFICDEAYFLLYLLYKLIFIWTTKTAFATMPLKQYSMTE